jgi:hypothetical protein
MEIRPEGPNCSMQKDIRMDGHDDVNVVAFRNIMNAPQNLPHFCIKMFSLLRRVIQKL